MQSLKGCGKTTELTRGKCRRAMQIHCQLVRGETRRAVPCFTIPFCASKAPRGEKGILSNLFSSSWRDEILHSANCMTEKCLVHVCVGVGVRVCGKDREK